MVDANFTVDSLQASQRIDAFLAPRLPLLSRTKLRILLASGKVLRNGVEATAGMRLRVGDRVAVEWDPHALPPVLPEELPVPVVFEDAWLAAVNKPAGMLMHATSGVKRGTLCNAILGLWNPWLHPSLYTNKAATPVKWPFFVQRLDRETSGLVLIARSASVAAKVGKCFLDRRAGKSYVAILDGEVPSAVCTVDEPIGRVSEEQPQWRCHQEGATARSTVTVLAKGGGRTLALLQPHTGRTNQLRIHTAWIGHPILGDRVYGGNAAERVFLHAWRLEVPHPIGGEPLLLEAPLPAVFMQSWPGAWPTLPSAKRTQASSRE
jgi:23S rRNA pseudouridine1911/1915/1917 synthase